MEDCARNFVVPLFPSLPIALQIVWEVPPCLGASLSTGSFPPSLVMAQTHSYSTRLTVAETRALERILCAAFEPEHKKNTIATPRQVGSKLLAGST